MALAQNLKIRPVLLTVHRWLALALLILLVPVAVSGGLLVWHDEFDSLINPQRWAVSGPTVTLPPSGYLSAAQEALDQGLQANSVRYPESAGKPVTVSARGPAAPGERPRFVTIYLDPPTGKVLDRMEFGSSWMGILHILHGNLFVPQYSGRQIVGWVGVAMLILSLSGIYLWWPRNRMFLRGLRFRRTADMMNNLHHVLGFWISIPLAIVSLTGIYISFPQTSRTLVSNVAPVSAPGQRASLNGPLARDAALTPDRALELALAAEPGSLPAAVFLPVSTGGGRRSDGAATTPIWRVQVRHADLPQPVTLLINDRDSSVQRPPEPLAGDRVAQWMRWIHDGQRGGIVWQIFVFLTGILPLVFGITGVVMWWHGHQRRKARMTAAAVAQYGPAE